MPRKQVTLLVRTTNEWNRQILMGVGQYATEVGGWEFTIPKADENDEVFLPQKWRGDGIICRLSSNTVRNQVLATRTPVVNVSWLGTNETKIAHVNSDETACGRDITRYFLERHFQNFAYLGPAPWLGYGSLIPDSIESILVERGLKLASFEFPSKGNFNNQFQNKLRDWLKHLPKPVALTAWSSDVGRVATSLCIELGINVPELVSIVCVEHDDLFSTLATIPLSSLDQDAWRVGYTAAKTLDLMMKGEPTPSSVSIPPLAIIQRRSSESSAANDPIVKEAYRFIHEKLTSGLNVDEVVRELRVSRRTLEKKFQEHFQRSPAAIIRSARLLLVKRLLRETTLTLNQIADRSGFSQPEVLIRTFKRDTGLTPGQFRNS